MATRNAQLNPGVSGDRSSADHLTNGLGWFSIGLGLAEVLAPEAIAAICGVRRNSKQRTLLRLYGARELAAGIGILSQPRPAGWVWGRVAGDAVDLSSLAAALRDDRNDKARVIFALASVIGVTAADIYCAQALSSNGHQSNGNAADTRVVRTIILNKSIEDAYAFWHNFENLPRIMDYLDSVRYTGDRRTHWIAKGPVGAQIEWDAETVTDTPNQTIGWRTVAGSAFDHSGSVRFEQAPGGRGTLVRVEMDFSGNRGAAMMGKLLKMDLGRRIMHDLRNFKQVLEVGEVTQSDASIHPGMHPAHPPEEPAYQH